MAAQLASQRANKLAAHQAARPGAFHVAREATRQRGLKITNLRKHFSNRPLENDPRNVFLNYVQL